MEPSVAGEGGTGKDPYLPPLCKVGDLIGPRAPQDVAGAKLDEGNLSDLAIKLFFTVARFTTEWVAKRLHLSLALSRELLIQMCTDGIIEETMQTTQGPRSAYVHRRPISTMNWPHCRARASTTCGTSPRVMRIAICGLPLRDFTTSCVPTITTKVLTGRTTSRFPSRLAQRSNWRSCRPIT